MVLKRLYQSDRNECTNLVTYIDKYFFIKTFLIFFYWFDKNKKFFEKDKLIAKIIILIIQNKQKLSKLKYKINRNHQKNNNNNQMQIINYNNKNNLKYNNKLMKKTLLNCKITI